MGFSEVSFATVAGKGTFRFIYNFYFLHIYIYIPWTSKTKQRIVFGAKFSLWTSLVNICNFL